MRKRNGTRNGRTNGSLAADMMKGAIAGAVGVWMMDRVGWDMYLSEDPEAFQQEKEAQVEGKWASHAAVGKMANAMGKDLTETQQHRLGKGMHYGLGVMPGALYGALRNRVDGLDAGGGLAYGLGLFLMNDEIMNPLLGISSGPMEYPWQAHWRGLVTHMVLGATTDTVLDVLDNIA
jgi:uncharacterized membrane protein YagU involved in acid resistance